MARPTLSALFSKFIFRETLSDQDKADIRGDINAETAGAAASAQAAAIAAAADDATSKADAAQASAEASASSDATSKANAAQAAAIQRANHTGTQAISTVVGLQTALDQRRTYDSDDFFAILVGDSIMAGVTAGGADSDHYLSVLLPSESYFSGRATIVNKGVSGRTATQIKTDYTTGANTDCYAYRPGGASNPSSKRAVIIVNGGINDYRNSANMTTSAADMLSYVSTAMADGFEVWLCVPLPSAETGIYDYQGRTGFYTYVQALRTSTIPTKIIDFNSLVVSMQYHTSGLGQPYTSDGLHPNNTLYQMMASEINRVAWSDQRFTTIAVGTAAFQNTSNFKAESITGTATVGAPISVVTSASEAYYYSQATGAGSSRQWRFGHTQNALGNIPANGFGMVAYNGSAYESGLVGFRLGGGLIGQAVTLVPKTVATLIATPATNTFATVTDAASFSAGGTVTGGGSTKCMVQYDGSNWKMVLQLY